jgi:hypothetical protein
MVFTKTFFYFSGVYLGSIMMVMGSFLLMRERLTRLALKVAEWCGMHEENQIIPFTKRTKDFLFGITLGGAVLFFVSIWILYG